MDSSSLAFLFMQEGNLPCLPLSWATSGEQSVEELQQQLTSTSLELQSTRETATLQSRINEAEICRLQGLLDAARKERDEARTKCSKLQECLLQLSRSPQVPVMLAAESPSSCLTSSISSTSSPAEFGHPESPTADTMSIQEVKLKITHVEASEPDATTVQVDALPERGRLLQAVLQAGPLLQNLLLAGPLPQWRYPPPQLSTVEIPKVPLVSNSLPLKYPSSLGSGGNPATPSHHMLRQQAVQVLHQRVAKTLAMEVGSYESSVL
ncbi:hypothetical protein L7F22_008684 [Adiantum nelumboides]|nr:hypothetical protein [Adiantum nelumboides]